MTGRGVAVRAAIAALATSLAACGSTVPDAQRQASGASTELSGLSPETGGGVTSASSGGAAATSAAVSARAPQGRSGTTRSSGAAAAAAAAKLPPVRLGYTIVDTSGAGALGAIGYDANAQLQASKDMAKALINHANKTGGVGGRKIEGYETTVTIADGLEATRIAAACTHATEDQKVDVMVDTDVFYTEQYLACFVNHRTPIVNELYVPSRAFVLKGRPFLASTFALPDRTEAALVDGLNRAKFFDKAVLAAVIDDEPVIKNIYSTVIKPMLRKLGVTVVSERYMTPVDPGAQATEAQGAVLEWVAKHVDHVLIATNVLGMIALANAQQSQNYYPRWGIGDYQLAASAGPGNGAYIATLGKALKDALGVSVNRGLIQADPAASGSTITRDPAQLGPGLKRCLDVLSEETGQDYYTLAPDHRGRSFVAFCDSFFLWLQAARAVGAGVSRTNWGSAIPGIGASFTPALVNTTNFTATHVDGANDYRVGVYYDTNPMCGCYKALWRERFPLPATSS
jgi:hypothetical protein